MEQWQDVRDGEGERDVDQDAAADREEPEAAGLRLAALIALALLVDEVDDLAGHADTRSVALCDFQDDLGDDDAGRLEFPSEPARTRALIFSSEACDRRGRVDRPQGLTNTLEFRGADIFVSALT